MSDLSRWVRRDCLGKYRTFGSANSRHAESSSPGNIDGLSDGLNPELTFGEYQRGLKIRDHTSAKNAILSGNYEVVS